jgi:hypothetical protein
MATQTVEQISPRLSRSGRELMAKIETQLGKPLNRHSVRSIMSIVSDHGIKARQDGIDFPVMVPVIIQSRKWIRIVRADLDRRSIEQLVVNLCTQFPTIEMAEVAEAIHRAFPDFKTAAMKPPKPMIMQ